MSTAQDLPVTSPRARRSLALVPDVDTLDAPGTSTTSPVVWDDTEFESVLRKATPRLVRFAQRRLGNLHEAEEVSQEALLRTYQHRATLATEDDVMAWATFASNRLVIDRLRVRGRSISVADLPEGRRVARDTAEIAEARAEARLALDALDALPARQAAVLWAREVEGSTYEEISGRFGLSEPTVRSLLHRARKALRREYSLRGGTLPFAGVAILGPWLNPLTHAKRLRATASALVGTTALGVVGLGVFGMVGPLHNDIRTLPQTTRTTAAAPHVTTKAPAHKGAITSTATRTPTITSTQVTPHALHRYLPKACSSKSVGFNCYTAPSPQALWLGPTGTRIYVGSTDPLCPSIDTVTAATNVNNGLVGCDTETSTPQSKNPSGGNK